jgi:tripeptide aminopeptidase
MKVVETFLELVSIPSPSLKEGKIAQYVSEKLEEYGGMVWEDKAASKIGGECGNLVAHFPGKGKRGLILSAHLDTVEEEREINVIKENGVLKSDGTTILGADCKSGLAVILEVLRILKEEKREYPPLDIVFTVAEEKGLLGAKNLDFSLLRAREGYILDGGDLGSAVVKAPTHDRFTIKFLGKASHAGVHPEKGVNSIQAASFAVSSLNLGKIDEETTVNIGVIRGGKAINIVPEETLVEGEVRSLKKGKLEREFKKVKKAAREGGRKVGAKVEIERERLYESFTITRNAFPFRLAKKAAKEEKISFQEVVTKGGSDTNIFNAQGLTCLNIGVGAKNPHSNEESISISDLEKATNWILKILSLAVKEG